MESPFTFKLDFGSKCKCYTPEDDHLRASSKGVGGCLNVFQCSKTGALGHRFHSSAFSKDWKIGKFEVSFTKFGETFVQKLENWKNIIKIGK